MATTITVTEDVTEVTVTETTTQLNITPQVTTVGVSAVDITAANIASSISLTPTGNISATNVQAAFAEIGANEDFTTALKDKLDGIEELADVTDTANVTAAGAAMLTGADFTGDVTISNGELTVNGKAEAELFQGDIEGAIHFKGAVASGASLAKGDVVYISGHSGQKTEVDKADASDSNKMPAFGVVAADPVGSNVDVVTFGTLKTINTSAYSEGDELFVSTTSGQLTSTAPSGEGNLVQKIAKVVRAGNSGNIKVMGAGRTNATPNLNDGNIFIGDSNNLATTASFATQVASAETSHSDVLVDGDFTSSGFMKTDGAGNYSVESGSIAEVNDLTTAVTWANVPDANITQTSVTQHQAAINSGISITESQISNLQSYLTSYTETDPVFSAHAASGVTSTKINNWDTAYGWGDHSTEGYLTSIANGSIDTDQLASGAVTSAKVEAGAITGNLISSTTSIELGNPNVSPPFVSTNTSATGTSVGYQLKKRLSNGTDANHGGIGTTGQGYAGSRFTYLSTGEIAVGVFSIFGGTDANEAYFQPLTTSGANHDNKMRLGTSNSRWNQLYAGTATINTSDRNTKQQIETLSDAEARVATAAKGLLRKYKFNDAVEAKGNDARIHFGIVAQDLQDAFTAEGLNAYDYSMFCSDTWWEHEGETYNYLEAAPEGATEVTKLGVRYSELLAFIIAAI